MSVESRDRVDARARQSVSFEQQPTDCAAYIFVRDFGTILDGMNGFVMREREDTFFTVKAGTKTLSMRFSDSGSDIL